tara:strand:- start:242 stop:442 length:201 start_codon:yes stop_codon:yes gene_type:complete
MGFKKSLKDAADSTAAITPPGRPKFGMLKISMKSLMWISSMCELCVVDISFGAEPPSGEAPMQKPE